MKPLRFAYLSANDPRDKRIWSGTHHRLYKSLQQLGEVVILGPYRANLPETIGKILNQISLKLLGKRISYRHGLAVSRNMGAHFTKLLSHQSFDYIIAPAASAEIAHVQTKTPIIYITDGTFGGCLNYHEGLSNLTENAIREGNAVEQLAISKSRLVIVSSEWAAQSVIQQYGKNNTQVKVIPYGANFDKLPAANDIQTTVPTTWQLLFVGVYWENKGGDIAFRAFQHLVDKGYPVHLTVLGCVPPEHISHPNMTVIRFIDKNDDEGQKRMADIYLRSHFLLLPTRFDCSPIVINEASAFGIPSLVTDTGGVAGHLNEGENGFLIPYEDTGEGYAKKVMPYINQPEMYLTLRQSTRWCYEEKLNWQHWLQAFKQALP